MRRIITKEVIISTVLIFVLLQCGCSIQKYNTIGNFDSKDTEKLCKDKKYDEALKNVDAFLKKYPKNKSAISEKAYILISNGKNEEGLVLLTDLYENGEHNSTVLNNMSWAYNNLRMYNLANKYIDICLNSLTMTDKEYVNKGNALFGLKKYDEAIVYFDKGLGKNPNSTFALWGKGLSLYNKKEYAKCIDYFKKYQKLDGKDKSLSYYIKNSYLKLKDYDGAINEINNQIKNNPNNNSAYISIADVYKQKGDYNKAIDYYDSIIKKSPDYADAYYDKSICLVKLGKNDEACDNLKLAIKYDSEYQYDIQDEPEFDSLKNNDKFKALINLN